ncbi:hypothetical protein GUJ93_ZPchr0010g10111 [Zizania palustris]|uniref:DUF641 domain-containing protein n=1 Tax=Zizania palustris TaxID=103762 RepID=A0A8J5WFR1_ZIZPA|nr:hypothetical protein GUJ93_ZPchr0010g10111 [Zizania palustris]
MHHSGGGKGQPPVTRQPYKQSYAIPPIAVAPPFRSSPAPPSKRRRSPPPPSPVPPRFGRRWALGGGGSGRWGLRAVTAPGGLGGSGRLGGLRAGSSRRRGASWRLGGLLAAGLRANPAPSEFPPTHTLPEPNLRAAARSAPSAPAKRTEPLRLSHARKQRSCSSPTRRTLTQAVEVVISVASCEAATVEAALATASSFQAAHEPFLLEAAEAGDAATVSHLRRLSELKRLARGPPGVGALTAHLEAQVRENQALLRSFDAVVNRLQAALDTKDATAAMHSSPASAYLCSMASIPTNSAVAQVIPPCLKESTLQSVGTNCRTLPVMSVAGPLYELFVAMASSIWTLHRLAWAYDPAVGIFQVSQGTEYSSVYMENIVRSKGFSGSKEIGKMIRPKVGFTVVPGPAFCLFEMFGIQWLTLSVYPLDVSYRGLNPMSKITSTFFCSLKNAS